MNAKWIWIIILPVILSVGLDPGAGNGQQKETGQVTRVRLSVVAPEKISELISRCMKVDLTKLGDVALTDNDPEWHLAVTAVELQTTGEKRTGVAISTVIMEPLDESLNQSIIQILAKEGSMQTALALLKSKRLTEVKSSWLRADADTAIRQLCRGIIADFNTQYLQPAREDYQKQHPR